MTQFEPGRTVAIPCDVAQGAFPDECLVTINAASGPISGFVSRDSVNVKGEIGYLNGIIQEVTDETVAVWIRGSFFTTTGLAHFSPEWANSHLEPVG